MQQAVSLMLTGIWMLVLINESARMTALPETKSPAYIDGKIEPPPTLKTEYNHSHEARSDPGFNCVMSILLRRYTSASRRTLPAITRVPSSQTISLS